MRALRFEKTGPLDGLTVREIPTPVPAAGELLVQVKAAALNPGDVKNVQGKMQETVPRTPGRDFAGVVVAGSGERSGQAVFGSGGNLGSGRGADVVGGAMFEPCLAALAWRGRQVAISSSPEPRVSFNLVDFYHNESRLFGVDSLKLSFEETGEILRQLTPGIEAGTFPPPRVETFPLEEGPRLYRDLAESKLKTKPILIP
jgi:NADPH:quinone reductase-like Zn-dependent oxidoreductase